MGKPARGGQAAVRADGHANLERRCFLPCRILRRFACCGTLSAGVCVQAAQFRRCFSVHASSIGVHHQPLTVASPSAAHLRWTACVSAIFAQSLDENKYLAREARLLGGGRQNETVSFLEQLGLVAKEDRPIDKNGPPMHVTRIFWGAVDAANEISEPSRRIAAPALSRGTTASRCRQQTERTNFSSSSTEALEQLVRLASETRSVWRSFMPVQSSTALPADVNDEQANFSTGCAFGIPAETTRAISGRASIRGGRRSHDLGDRSSMRGIDQGPCVAR